MTYFLLFILGFLAAFGIIKLTRKIQGGNDLDDPLNPEQIKKRRENLDKIMALADKSPRITNDDVQKALGISETEATRYLAYLTDLGKLIRVGERGQQVYYQLPHRI